MPWNKYLKLEAAWILDILCEGQDSTLEKIYHPELNVASLIEDILSKYSTDTMLFEMAVRIIGNSMGTSKHIRKFILQESRIFELLRVYVNGKV